MPYDYAILVMQLALCKYFPIDVNRHYCPYLILVLGLDFVNLLGTCLERVN